MSHISCTRYLDEANVGCRRVYAHYLNKDHLLLSGMPEFISEYIQIEGDTVIPSVEGLFTHMQEAYPFFKALMGTDGAAFGIARGRQMIRKQLLEKLGMLEANGMSLSVPVRPPSFRGT